MNLQEHMHASVDPVATAAASGVGPGVLAIAVVVVLLELAAVVYVVRHYLKIRKQTLYAYENAIYLGAFLFSTFLLISTVQSDFQISFNLEEYVLNAASTLIAAPKSFCLLVLPFLVITAGLLTISNVSLMRHEGYSVRNLVGAIGGIFLIAASLAVTFGWDALSAYLEPSVQQKGWGWVIIPDYGLQIFLASFVCYIQCLICGIIVYAVKAARRRPDFDRDYSVVLGCAIKSDGTPTPLLRGRADAAKHFAAEQLERTGKPLRYVASGGQGSDECISEAESIRNYLVEQGVPTEDILLENRSATTLENMRFSRELLEQDAAQRAGSEEEARKAPRVAFATTGYHVLRSGIYARQVGLDAQGIGAKTRWYFWPNAFARELAAMLVLHKHRHTLVAVALLIAGLLLGFAAFLALGL